MPPLSIRRLASGGVITTYNCVSRCSHCLYNCGPHREKAYLDRDTARAIFACIARCGCRSVHIGGGEPLLDLPGLLQVLAAAAQAGVGIDYVETNSAWFVSADQAKTVLGQLHDAGVATLLVSISPFHNAHIPYDRVQGVIDACRLTGMQVFPWVNAFVRDLSRLDTHRPHPMADFEAAFGAGYLARIPDRFWIHLGGRALTTFRPVFATRPVARVLETAPLSCAGALADTSHFHIDLSGNYIPGLCSGLAFAMEDLGAPLPEGKYPLLDRLAATGIRGLYAFAEQSYEYAPSRDVFLNHCDLCTDIRSFLSRIGADLFAELAPKGFYDELRSEKTG